MRIGIIGLGLRAAHVLGGLAAVMPELAIAGYVDPDPCGRDLLAKKIDPGTAYPDLAALLDAELDLLFVSSPNYLHLEHIRAGLTAGVRVFAEKPIVISPEQTYELAELLAEHGTERVIVGLVLRYSQHMRDLRAAQADGLIGKVVSVEANEHIAPYHGAFFMRDWRRQSRYSGGFMLEKCCHDLDIYNMITGSWPIRVASFGGRNAWVAENAPAPGTDTEVYQVKKSFWEAAADPFTSDGDTVDNQVAILEYASGARLAFHTNTNVPDEHRRFCVMGTKGMAEGDFIRGSLKITDAHTREVAREHDYTNIEGRGAHYGADGMMVQDLADHLQGKLAQLPVSVVDCMAAGLVAMALDEARTTGKIVDLTPMWAKLDSYGL